MVVTITPNSPSVAFAIDSFISNELFESFLCFLFC